MLSAELTISSKNYSSWSLRGWLLCKMAGLEFTEVVAPPDEKNRKELLLLSPSVLVPRLTHGVVTVWDTLAIAEYMHDGTLRRVSCLTIRLRAPTAAPSPERCIPASRTCARPCR